MIHRAVRFLLYLFFTSRCPFCGKCMPFSAHCCEACEETVRNRKAVYQVYEDSESFWFDCLIAPFSYEEEPAKAVKDLKFYDTVSNAEHLSYYLVQELLSHQIDQYDIIIPVPMTRKRRKERGFNQTEKIAREISYLTNRPVCSRALIKIRETRQQHTLTEHQRRENLKGAFSVVRPDQMKGKRILLVDDVFTTGSTVNECAKTLKEYGAVSVCVATICKVQYHASTRQQE